jgi:hypothetical protein
MVLNLAGEGVLSALGKMALEHLVEQLRNEQQGQ